MTVTVWLQAAMLVQASVARHVRVMVCGHWPFVTVLRTEITTLLQQFVNTVGSSNAHTDPHSTTLLLAHCRSRHGLSGQGIRTQTASPKSTCGSPGVQTPPEKVCSV